MKRPSSRIRPHQVTLTLNTWGTDVGAGPIIAAQRTVANVPCSVHPGEPVLTQDEAERWTQVTPYRVHFYDDPGLKKGDVIGWKDPRGRYHNILVSGVHDAAGRGATFAVNGSERS